MLDFRIQTFVAVWQTGSYTKAADLLALTQPAVSQHMKHLEERFGTALVRYEGRILSLTKAGEILYRFASNVLVEAARIEEKLCQVERVMPLRVGATRTIGEYVLPAPLGRYLRRHPDVELSLIVDNTKTLLHNLDEGDLDVLFVEGLFDPQHYQSSVFLEDSLVAVTSADDEHALSAKSLKDLLPRRLLIREAGSGSRSVLESTLAVGNVSLSQFHAVLEIGDVEAIKTLVLQGQGITFLFRRAIVNELKRGTMIEIPLEDFSVTHQYAFVRRQNTLDEELYSAFLAEIIEGIGK